MNTQTQEEYWNGDTGALWAREADQLDSLLSPFIAPITERVSHLSPRSILDVGCGAGALTLACASQHMNATVTGVDLSKPLLKVARDRAFAKASGAIFFKSDITKFNSAEPIDAMISRFGMMFFDDPVASFKTLRGMMAPGGNFIGCCWQSMERNDWLSVALKGATPHMKEVPEPPSPTAPGPFAFADKNRTQGIFEKAGWSNVALTPWTGQLVMPGSTVEDAADFAMDVGPLSSVMREQELDREAVRESVAKAFSAACPTRGAVKLKAAAWIVTARA